MITSQVRDKHTKALLLYPNNPEDPVFYFFVGHIPHRKKYSRGYDVNVIIHIYLIVKNLIYAENYKIVIKNNLSLLFFFLLFVLVIEGCLYLLLF
jgi:hypothetical protein